MISATQALNAATALHSQTIRDRTARQEHMEALTGYFGNAEKILSSRKLPQIAAKTIDLFMDETLTEAEQYKLAPQITLPILDKGLGYQLKQAEEEFDTIDSPDDKQDFIHVLQDTIYCIGRFRREPFQNYDGKNVTVRRRKILIQD